MRTLTRLYDNRDDAVATVQALEEAGIGHADVSLVSNNADQRYPTATAHTATVSANGSEAGTDAGVGAGLGAVLGGGAGLLAGIGALAIPGVGPVVAAGWLVATLAGAGVGAAVGGGAGGLIGSLTHEGVPERDAHVYAEGVRRGGSLLTVRVEEAQVATAEQILNGRGYVDPAQRRSAYEKEGWTGFDESAPAYDRTRVPPTAL